ncbi:rap guanine nucleotide exchange factor 1 isoform X3 [Cimex lectularius]|uniref:CRK SH3-binding GNRP n=1 Tax=Cimex lectularius TaxID=79782 RepID=A0A8I6RR92_CIMLE|nr:rap guanine nucleotide exchange factor 1 isoform X3 [Cimex lectularius]
MTVDYTCCAYVAGPVISVCRTATRRCFPHVDRDEGGNSGRGGNKLARRARSFKEDFLDIISQMRTSSGGSGGSNGTGSPRPPRSPKPRTSSSSDVPPTEERNPLADLDQHVKQVQLALKHFNDVVSKNKLEVLPGNGTIVLESVATIQGVLKTYVFIDQSTALMSATNQVYQSITVLIKLCDDVLIGGEKGLNKQNVTEVLQQVDEAVQNLVTLVRAKIADHNKVGSEKILDHGTALHKGGVFHHAVDPPLRNSLPDIPLTSRERESLESRAQGYSSESIVTAPPKPPLPTTKVWVGGSPPPPLPPKKKASGGLPSQSMERLSIRSDNSSLGSLDSMLNTSSKDEEELRAIMDEDNSMTLPDTSLLHHDFPGLNSSIVNGSQTSSCCWDSSCSNTSDHTHLTESPDPPMGFNNVLGALNTTLERTSGMMFQQHASNQSFNFGHSSTLTSSSSSVAEERRITTHKSSSSSTTTFASSSETSVTSLVAHQQVERRGSSVTEQIPPLPEKKRSRRERQPSQYDNVPTSTSPTLEKPPPLPPKKKHIMAYMEMFGNCSQPSASDLLRHSVHTYSLLQWQQQHQASITSTQSCSFTSHTFTSSNSNHETLDEPMSERNSGNVSPGLPPALPPKRGGIKSAVTPPPPEPLPQMTPPPSPTPVKPIEETQTVVANGGSRIPAASPETNFLFELDVSKHLVLMRPEEEGPAIRGGPPDALIIHATKACKNEEKEPDFLYQEAFLTTYRTFLSPLELIEKLCLRQRRFSGNQDPGKQRAAREAFSLLVRVVSDLTVSDLEEAVLKALMEFVYQLLCSGDLTMAKVLRVIIIEKYNNKILYYSINNLLPSQNIYTRQSTLVDFKSDHVAEQMTLLDSELFMKIEIPEVLIWAQEQNEERSPNLTRFTEHFNKMSYWARSRILEQNEAKDREKYVVKFIKIMKHLRKINNFNSYLALLSALDSAPIRRLEWQKHITEGLKEYCALIDSSSSFRAYRQALAETQPPCIPYIGLVLQDLTFVHIGNSDYLSDGVINFSKRWQQFNIVENMKRFKKGTYTFKKNERIIAFFSNFDDFLCEEAMWQISESIKPRGTKKTNQ